MTTEDESLEKKPVLLTPFSLIVAGSSQSGKSVFTSKILSNLKVLTDHTPNKIIISYSENADQYTHLKDKIPNIVFRKGLNFEIPENSLIVIEDQMSDAVMSSRIAELFTRKVHHKRCSVILIQQNLFPQGKHGRDIRLNTHYYAVFKSPPFISQVMYIERMTFPHHPHFLIQSYKDATTEPYTYLFLSLHSRVDDRLRVRAGILPGENEIIYLPNKK